MPCRWNRTWSSNSTRRTDLRQIDRLWAASSDAAFCMASRPFFRSSCDQDRLAGRHSSPSDCRDGPHPARTLWTDRPDQSRFWPLERKRGLDRASQRPSGQIGLRICASLIGTRSSAVAAMASCCAMSTSRRSTQRISSLPKHAARDGLGAFLGIGTALNGAGHKDGPP